MENSKNNCHFEMAWIGRCKEPAVKNGMCEKHSKEKCASCGAPATHDCYETGQFVCGAPLCDNCEHTNAEDGSNGGIGFFRVSALPEGMKEHCKKSEQKCFPWYVKGCGKDYPEVQAMLNKYNKGEATYLETDKLILDFIVEKNKIEEEKEKNGKEV